MSVDLDTIHKALRNVPEFDGNPNVLIRFLKLCDQLVQTYINPAPGHDLINLSLLNGILNKITGPAGRTLATNGTPSTWQGIRNTLVNNFSDHRDESALYTDLSILIQGSDTPQMFYERVQNLLSTIMTYVELHETVVTTVEAKRSLYKKLALHSYLRGLNDPLGSRIRCMRPNTLEDALQFAQEELNILYLQGKNKPTPSRNMAPFTAPIARSQMFSAPTVVKPQFPPHLPFAQNSHLHTFMTNRNPPPMQRMFQQNPNNPGPSRTQQIFRAMPRSDMSTGFKIPPRAQFSRQNPPYNQGQPMSGVSHPVARTLPPTRPNSWQNQGNSHANYRPREMHMNETQNPYESCFYNYEHQFIDEQYDMGPYEYPPQDMFLYDQNDHTDVGVSQNYDTNFHSSTDTNAPE